MLELIAKHHQLWISMVISFGCSKERSEDIVQSMYLRIHKYVKEQKRIMYDDEEVNKFFIYVTLKNMYMDSKKLGSRYNFVELDDEQVLYEPVHESEDLDKERAFASLMNEINIEMKTWHRYDRILSEKYLKSDYSLRDIASGSGISLTSIFNSMRNNKKVLKDKFEEDWQDYINGDYHLI
jgi:DNA-directed RNA polymerase specialized sigma24 family protein